MSSIHKRTLIIFIVLSISGILVAAKLAPQFEGSTQILLVSAGMSLFSSGLTTFLIKFIGADYA